MAPSSTDPDRNSQDHDEPTNPFVAFRRFADSQMSAIVNNVFGVFQSPPIRRQQAIDEYESMLKKRPDEEYDRCIQKARGDMEFYLMVDRYNVDEAKPTRDDLENDDSESPFDGLRCPYRPPERFGLLDLMLQPPAVDVCYLFQSSYSPLVLERQELFREHSGKMRAAFADLVAMQAGEGLLPADTFEKHSKSDPLCWAASLARRTDFGPSFAWESMTDRQSPDARPIRRRLSALPLESHAFDEQRKLETDKWKDNDYREAEEGDKADLASGVGGVSRALIELALRLNRWGEGESDEVKKNVAPDAYEGVLTAEPEIVDEQANAESNSDACDCFHCSTRERRNKEFLQWRREELEEENQDKKDAHDNDVNDDVGTANPTSELDQYHPTLTDYEAQLLRIEQRNNPNPESPQSDKAAAASTEKQTKPAAPKPSILSTLTTTEQRTLPDGTVTTKVVLKKRFSDGGEEVTERVHTQNAPSPQENLSVAPPKEGQITASESDGNGKGQQKTKKEGGWFWS